MLIERFSEPRKVLVIEDQFIIALALSDALEELGLQPVGPVRSVDEALQALDVGSPDAALLDIWLGDCAAYDVAQRLNELAVPYIVTGGNARPDEPPSLAMARRLPKPFSPPELRAELARLGLV
jgi:CheY-like chemotaxis protein